MEERAAIRNVVILTQEQHPRSLNLSAAIPPRIHKSNAMQHPLSHCYDNGRYMLAVCAVDSMYHSRRECLNRFYYVLLLLLQLQ